MRSTGRPASVLVAGAGPAGLVMAAELLRHGVAVRIVDQSPRPASSSRAIAIQARTLEILADIGIGDRILEKGHRIHGAAVYADGKRIVHLDFGELDSPYPFAVDLPQAETERILADHLNALGVSVEHRTTLIDFHQNDEGVLCRLGRDDGSAEELRADYLVGCDGAHSTVRHVLGLSFEGESRPQNFLLADVHLDWNQPDDEWVLWFSDRGLLAVFPLPEGLYRVIADECSAEPAFEELQRLWTERAPGVGKPLDAAWISSFRIHQRKVDRYREYRVFLAGDAAHVQSPAGGQGMNTGIQDAYNLAWKLALVLRGKSPASLLESYPAEREPVARDVLSLTGQMTDVATLRHPVRQHLRNRILPLLAQFEVIEQRFLSRLGETSIHYRSSPIVSEYGRWWGAKPVPGDRAPAIGELLRTPRFKVLLFAGKDPPEETMERMATLDRYMRDGYRDDVDSWLIARRPTPWSGAVHLDESGSLHYQYGAGVPSVFIVRPDNYIGFRSLGVEALPVLGYFGAIFDAEPRLPPV